MHTVYFTDEFVPVERSERKLENIVDVWLRRNLKSSGKIKMAEEIYLKFPLNSAPSFEELERDIDKYFEQDLTPPTTIDDVVMAINELANLILSDFGGEA